jgi:uncharacterized protein (DUF1501 family)
MINSFLVTLVNSATPPVNPSSLVGDVLWPTIYRVKTYTPVEEAALQILFNDDGDYLHYFLTAIQMLFVVESSVMVSSITADDPRTSYNRVQLLGQFEGVDPLTYSYQQVNRMLASLPDLQAETFLTGDELQVYRSSLSPLDKLAAVLSFFGKRP